MDATSGHIAIIPARGGSKRVPRKNIRPFAGRPMLHWAIGAALASGCFARVIVSTDDDEIANAAISGGAEAPFRRAADLSGDATTVGEVMRGAVEWLESSGGIGGHVCLIYPTAPFVAAHDLRRGLEALEAEPTRDYALSVCEFGFPVQRGVRRTASGGLAPLHPEHVLTRSQDLEPAYHDAAQFSWGRAVSWRENRPTMGESTAPVVIPRYRVQDIDTPDDWKRAELMFAALNATDPDA